MSTTAPTHQQARRASAASAVGSLVEWYDFALYGAAAALVFNTQFFHSDDPTTGLLAAFAAFAVGYFARPFGGVVFGHLGDKVGRKPVMIFTLVLMGISTALIGLLPTYDSIGVAAPILLVVLRVLQGLGAGAEYAGAITLSAESAPPTHRGFYASWSGAGVWIGSALGVGSFQLCLWLTGDSFDTWGWRLPFLVSLVMLGISLYIRRSVKETDSFEQAKETDTIEPMPLVSLLRTDKGRLAVALGSNMMLSGFSYIPQVWALSYLTNDLAVAASAALGIQATMLVLGALSMPFFGRLGDRIGRRRLFLFGICFGIVWAFPMFMLIDTGSRTLIVLALSICFVGAVATCYAAQAAFLTELFPPSKRYSGVAFAREVSGALLGGTAPLAATAMVAAADSWWPVATWMVVMALISLVAVYCSKNYRSDHDQLDAERFNHNQSQVPSVRTRAAVTR
ncbi:MFS transporter [Nocardioides hwasunensis]|uniref:MHS family MFS transporter n=1 Tax=Nocardioides hwasunensis TaxID=397258 RepID=A0ABR8MNA8_9ACTN|nr:MFS transporter [Nocardioides hwasunensis]MBD3915574.1 MHS family MFS transporter [Nocardioides hwasunensis]